ISEHYGGDTEKAKTTYRGKINKLLSHFSEAASTEYPSVIFFAYSKADRMAIRNANGNTALESPLSHLLQSIVNTGFCVKAIWPIRTEKPNEKFDSTRI